MLDGHCKDCRHWQTEGVYPRNKGWGICALPELEADYNTHESLAYVKADYSGDLETSPDFGCVQFEKKDA